MLSGDSMEHFSILTSAWSELLYFQHQPCADEAHTRGNLSIITFVPLSASRVVRTIIAASGQRESATNRLGEHGGVGLGPMWLKCKVLHEPPDC